MRRQLNLFLSLLCCLLLTCCRSGKSTRQETIPKEPNFLDSTQWYVVDRNGDADIFYIISTETGDYKLADGTMCHFADTYADSLRMPMLGEMEGVDMLLSGQLNFFSPYYRQCSLQSFIADSLTAARLPLATDDVRRAFDHYINHFNQGRPFILAGFSQGAMIALDLLCEMDDTVYSRMVAAYLIGISIPQQMLRECPKIKPATCASDLGVTICYNSVRDTSCTMWPRNAVAINPVNWHTDAATALLVTEPSPRLPLDSQKKDTLTVSLDSASNLLLVGGYTATDYIIPLIGCEGNYHSREIWLYRDCLRDNMQERVRSMINKK